MLSFFLEGDMFFLKIFTKNIVKKYQIIDEERKYKNFNLKIFFKNT